MNTLIININPSILEDYLDENVRELCKECKRYGLKVCCPPYLPKIEFFRDKFNQYEKGVLIIKQFIIDDVKNWKNLGKVSSEKLREDMMNFVSTLHSNFVCYGAGSCKNCTECSWPCKFPNKQLIPLEGTGINVVSLVEDVADITIKFPVENYGYFYRVGMVLYGKKI